MNKPIQTKNNPTIRYEVQEFGRRQWPKVVTTVAGVAAVSLAAGCLPTDIHEPQPLAVESQPAETEIATVGQAVLSEREWRYATGLSIDAARFIMVENWAHANSATQSVITFDSGSWGVSNEKIERDYNDTSEQKVTTDSLTTQLIKSPRGGNVIVLERASTTACLRDGPGVTRTGGYQLEQITCDGGVDSETLSMIFDGVDIPVEVEAKDHRDAYDGIRDALSGPGVKLRSITTKESSSVPGGDGTYEASQVTISHEGIVDATNATEESGADNELIKAIHRIIKT